MSFQIIGIAALLIFYGCYFIKMLNQRHKGIKTDQLGKEKVGFVKFVEITMKIVTYIVPIVEIISIIINTTSFSGPVRMIGACIGMVGVAIFIISGF